ncbi:hypothetical protein PRIPAC_92351 [Pristionchus pacificus]|uniref:Peptidase n=1 Tax=Pristionchus pacificus TaxID=54126 RepID=A0A2A6CD82_PRIPA|nr:hypothetical protein PRIPAC_92351 [Pristionchus pacificus]|eukprot:PDM76195.1 Peptidase [Pristionchus pacificus]
MLLVLVQGLCLLLSCLLLVQCSRCSAKLVRDTTKCSERVSRHSRLSSGIRVATDSYKAEGGNKAKITVSVGVGSRHETDDINGIAHFTEHMLLKGSRASGLVFFPCHSRNGRRKNRAPLVPDRTVDGVARRLSPTGRDMYETFRLCFEFSLLNGATTKEITRFKMECEKKEDVGTALATLSDLMINPDISDINGASSHSGPISNIHGAGFLQISAEAQKLAFHPNPLSLFVEGQLYSNFSVMASDIRHFYAKHYKAKNTVITAVGEVDHDEIVRLAEELFKDYPQGDGVSVPVSVWRHDSRVCFTQEAREVFGMLAVQAPSRALPKNATIAIVVRLIEWFPESAYPAHLTVTEDESNTVESAQMWWSIQAFKEYTMIGRMFVAKPGREVIVIAKLIAKWRYLAYDMTEENLKLAKDGFHKVYLSKDLDRASIRLVMDMMHCGRVFAVEEDRARCEAITLPQFRSACKRLLLDGDFTFVAFGPPDSAIPTRDEMKEALRRPKDEE